MAKAYIWRATLQPCSDDRQRSALRRSNLRLQPPSGRLGIRHRPSLGKPDASSLHQPRSYKGYTDHSTWIEMRIAIGNGGVCNASASCADRENEGLQNGSQFRSCSTKCSHLQPKLGHEHAANPPPNQKALYFQRPIARQVLRSGASDAPLAE